MFGKQTISNFSTYLKGFDRIFLSASVLKNNKESQDLVNALIGASLSPNSIVLNSKTVLSPAIDKTLIQRLSQSGILFPKQIPTTYLVAARELSIKKKVMAHAAKCILMIDSSKLSAPDFLRFASISDFDTIITDSGI
ncbi:MAG: hypothetical protein II980_07580, partial [Clostridia bacterium]|nr:hypothetical protein [Clostridia bacterium]